MKHLDLFSGIGGFALATEMVWDNVEHIFCDNDAFSQAILKKHWPDSPNYGDIRTLTADAECERLHHQTNEQKLEGKRGSQSGIKQPRDMGIDILTGGFPCQPFSQAGRRKGTEDDRHLWPEMRRIIQEFSPRFVVGENVRGFTNWNGGLVFDQVQSDLEALGYEVVSFILPAVAVNAPHRRDRVWIVGYSKAWSDGRHQRTLSSKTQSGSTNTPWNDKLKTNWNSNWPEVAAELCRVDDGIPRRLDRNPRLKGLGNAIVPQVAAEIFKVIKYIDES